MTGIKKIIVSIFVIFSAVTASGCIQPPKVDTESAAKTFNKKSFESASNPAQQANPQAASQSQQQSPAAVEKPQATDESEEKNPPPSEVSNDRDLVNKYKYAVIKTNFGDIKIKFYGEDAPITVQNFLHLAKKGFYDNTKFHRVISNFMIQGGDPNSKDSDWNDDGQGGPGYAIPDESSPKKIVRGSVAMANSGPGTGGSQFFIVTKEATPTLDGVHTNFGEVVSGMENVVMKIDAVKTTGETGTPPDHPTEDVVIKSIELLEK